MGDAVIRELGIPGKTSDCVQAPSDPKQDKCQVQVLEGTPTGGNTFILERKGKDFSIASSDQARINKLFPSFKPPAQDLKDYLLARGEFFKAFGDAHEPSDFGKSIKLSSSGSSPMEIVVNYTNLLSSFIGTGEIDPKNAVKKLQLSDAVQAGTFAYADSQLGPKIAEVLGQIDKTAGLSVDARGRVAFLIAVQEAWNKLWPQLEPAANKVSSDLGKNMKFSAAQIVRFLFVDHVLTDQGIKAVFKDQYETGKKFFDEMSRLDVDGSQFGDYYELLRKALKQIKTPKLPKEEQEEFNKRLALLDQALAEAARNKIAFLANQSTQKSAKESLRIKYGDNPTRLKVLDALLKNLEVNDVSSRPNFTVKIDAVSQEWRAMVNSQLDAGKKKEHVEAVNYLLKQLFERNGKMQMFWQTDYQEMDNLYDTVKRSLLSEDSKTLERLVQWALTEASNVDLNLNPDSEPRPPLRKWFLISELGVAGIGTGAAFAFQFAAKDPNLQYYGTGGSIILGASGLGAAGGNLIAYGAKVDPKYDWLLHTGGAIVGGLLGGIIYGAATGWAPGGGIMPPPGNDPGRRFPVDPYGP